MRYVSFEYRDDNRRAWGISWADKIIDLPAAGVPLDLAFPSRLIAFIREGKDAWNRIDSVIEAARTGRLREGLLDPKAVRLLAPLPRSAKNVFALGLNYREHAAEAGRGANLPDVPIYFSKAATAIAAPEQPFVLDEQVTRKLDWEIELGVVIGVGGRAIPLDQALNHVFGYTVINDLSARDLQHGRPENQWFLGKSLDGSCPMGPVLVSTDEIPDPQQLEIALRVNGVEKQRSNTRNMIFPVAAIIADLSHYLTLEPGDVITTGTPNGVGGARKPPEFLKSGDIVEAEIEAIGVLRTPIVGPSA
ncbi:MAG TPA: fumarylacetoacetate hydrolase family protein [Chloroflexota bacterium]|nr:fumarylacetoacetate hydrolase family protein [Chloroflexota bacterium]